MSARPLPLHPPAPAIPDHRPTPSLRLAPPPPPEPPAPPRHAVLDPLPPPPRRPPLLGLPRSPATPPGPDDTVVFSLAQCDHCRQGRHTWGPAAVRRLGEPPFLDVGLETRRCTHCPHCLGVCGALETRLRILAGAPTPHRTQPAPPHREGTPR